MLHVANGAVTATRLRASGPDGEIVDLDDLMIEGPVPNRLAGAADWDTRAAWLAAHLDIPARDYLARHAERRRVVASTRGEVMLWFEHDLHCQANLLHLLSLDWRGDAALALVCPEDVDGVADFRGLGQLTAVQFAALFAERTPLGPADRAHAREVWNAWCDERPTALAATARGSRFAAAVDAHLRRLPSPSDGLDDIERTVVRLVPPAGMPFTELFTAWNATPVARPYGFGDHSIAHRVRRLARGDGPPLAIDGPTPPQLSESASWYVRATGAPPDAWRAHEERWVGGVRVPSTAPRWCWDERAARPVWAPAR